MSNEFIFLDPGRLVDGELELALTEKTPADEIKKYVPAYKFLIRDVRSGEEMGHINLRIGDSESMKYCGHIGYGVNENFRGHHYAARSCKLLFPFIKKHGITQVYITCNPDNHASRRTCELAGGRLLEIFDLPEDTEMFLRGDRKKCRYEILLD